MNFKKMLMQVAICMAAVASMAQTHVYTAPEFAAPPMQWRPVPLWFWNNTSVNAQTVEEQLEQMITVDNYGGCAILPFGAGFQPGYLSDDYFALYEKAIEVAKRHGASMSLYDEYGFPSGSMGAING